MFLPIRLPRFVTCTLRWVLVLSALAALASTVPAAVLDESGPSAYGQSPAPADGRHPAAVAADQAFFASLVHGALPAEEVLPPLLGAYAADPGDARTSLLLGTHYLRLAAMGQHGRDPHAITHLMLAERFLERACRLDPADSRIAAFLVPVQLALAEIERAGEARQAELVGELWQAYETDPEFNGFTVAMLGYQSPRGSEAFVRGLEALRGVQEKGCAEDDATCRNAPRWPHAVEGYLSFFADYELKAGEPQRARLLLDELREQPAYASWPSREMVEQRLVSFDEHTARFADGDPANDPPTAVLARGCAACHRQ
jgi:hypothetical protein